MSLVKLIRSKTPNIPGQKQVFTFGRTLLKKTFVARDGVLEAPGSVAFDAYPEEFVSIILLAVAISPCSRSSPV
jgi:hypothetical protein